MGCAASTVPPQSAPTSINVSRNNGAANNGTLPTNGEAEVVPFVEDPRSPIAASTTQSKEVMPSDPASKKPAEPAPPPSTTGPLLVKGNNLTLIPATHAPLSSPLSEESSSPTSDSEGEVAPKSVNITLDASGFSLPADGDGSKVSLSKTSVLRIQKMPSMPPKPSSTPAVGEKRDFYDGLPRMQAKTIEDDRKEFLAFKIRQEYHFGDTKLLYDCDP